MKYITVEHSIN